MSYLLDSHTRKLGSKNHKSTKTNNNKKSQTTKTLLLVRYLIKANTQTHSNQHLVFEIHLWLFFFPLLHLKASISMYMYSKLVLSSFNYSIKGVFIAYIRYWNGASPHILKSPSCLAERCSLKELWGLVNGSQLQQDPPPFYSCPLFLVPNLLCNQGLIQNALPYPLPSKGRRRDKE